MHSTIRLLAGSFILMNGLIHLTLWREGYRDIPTIGTLFLLQIAASVAVAAAVVLLPRRLTLLAGVVLSLGTLASLAASRTVGIFGFTEGVTPEAAQSLAAAIGTLAALALCSTVIPVRPMLVAVPVRAHAA